MSEAREKAQDAIYEKIATSAEEASPEDLEKLASAFQRTAYGPQGGDYTHQQTNRNDYHYTSHQGEERARPATGFGEE